MGDGGQFPKRDPAEQKVLKKVQCGFYKPVECEQLVFPVEPLLILQYQHFQIVCCLLKNKMCKI